MLFVLIFVILTLALPLSAEIYRKGSDNVVSRTGQEIVEIRAVSSLISIFGRALTTLSNFAKGSIIILVGGVIGLGAIKALSFLIRTILYLFR